jgi:peptide/nickel transport system substrate-binding protein
MSEKGKRIRRWQGLVAVALAAAVGLLGVGASASAETPVAQKGSSSNGSLTVLEAEAFYGTWPSLDPPANPGASADADYFDAIYDTLFYQGLNGKIIPELATGYKFLDGGKAVQITLRQGVTFSDGTPFNAEAVAFNIKRDLEPQYACLCDQEFPVSSVTTPTPYTVVLNLTRVYSPIIDAFLQDTPNWIVSPTALQKMGEKAFGQKPVGAGPFEVVTNQPNFKLVLKRNPHYWQKGKPYLSNLTFQVIGSDASAYDALISGGAQAYEIYSSYTSLKSVAQRVTVAAEPAKYGVFLIRLNTSVAPFNNQLAREAMYYATNPEAIDKGITANKGVITQSISAPGAFYQESKVPGYRTYDLAKAKALVRQLGGLKVNFLSLNDPGEELTAEALKAEWAQAGITVTLTSSTGINIEQDLEAGKWDAELGQYGGSDPALFTGIPVLTAQGLSDPTLQAMAAQADETLGTAAQTSAWDQIYKYISDKAYMPILFAVPFYNLAVHGVSGPGLTTPLYQVLWQDVRRS